MSEENIITAVEFFENTAPEKTVVIATETTRPNYGNAKPYQAIPLPQIRLHCGKCDGARFFNSRTQELGLQNSRSNYSFITYTCKDCEEFSKLYCIRAVAKDTNFAHVVKFGEQPAFGPPTPARLLRILDSEKEYFLKGRRCEIQGLGIGAFTYYRRIIENKRNAIFDEVIRVAKTLKADASLISEFEEAKKQTQFSNAVNSIKHGIPEALLINGHNPLLLLHEALSDGLHAGTDEECLGLATDIRVVLIEFVKKMAEAMNDDAQLNTAVSNLLKRKSQKAKKNEDEQQNA